MVYKPIRIPRFEHTLSRQAISKAALTVLYQLHHAGYQAYLVGGGVRDVLLERSPKDFDVVTNALPEQIKSIFAHHCHLIGRRFLLAHVRFGREIVEVATFRAHHNKGGDGVMQDGRILRDNVYGDNVDEDALRRDFTINALYYDINDFSLLDYANGLTDLRDGIIRSIGNPQLRYREDPVRMLRAIRFAAKLGFTLAPETASPVYELGDLLADVNAARLFEEVGKLFLSGYAMSSFEQLRHFNLLKHLFAQTAECLDDPIALALIEQTLRNTDARIAENKPVTSEFLLSALLWPPITRSLPNYRAKGLSEQDSFAAASRHVLLKQFRRVAIPRRITGTMDEIWLLQPRLMQRRSRKRNLKILEHPRFRAGYDFLSLRAQAGEPVSEWVTYWARLQAGEPEEEPTATTTLPKRPRRYRRPPKPQKPTNPD
ncbi:MAG: hypothetical protein BWK79_11165 [Beggiatoa sp. IS2]|nr:MAG: hypothetical protein BWK79_11165 [Beggiatoa sp. IS2]